MENEQRETPRKPVRRRRKKNPVYVFVHSYLPVIAIGLVVVLFIIFAVNSIRRSNQRREQARQESLAALASEQQVQQELDRKAGELATQARALAYAYEYEAAIALIDEFPGNPFDYDELSQIREECIEAQNSLVEWEDPAAVPNLSFQLLVADPARAFSHAGYGNSFRNNFITIHEFSAILEQLYANNYVLVDQDDIFFYSDTSGFSAKTLRLPAGKKPIMLTQTQVYDYEYMADSNGTNASNSAGFATKLLVDGNGALVYEYIDPNGQTVTGAYDMVPILEAFIAKHPDFSYKGARATIAVSGYDGILGYRTDPDAAQVLGDSLYQNQRAEAPVVAQALRDAGYRLACYTYGNVRYGQFSSNQIKADQDKWSAEVVPLLGSVDTLVLAKQNDISDTQDPYSGDKFQLLSDLGYRYFYGICTNGQWAAVSRDHVRQGRIMLTGSALVSGQGVFEGIFDPAAVLDPQR